MDNEDGQVKRRVDVSVPHKYQPFDFLATCRVYDSVRTDVCGQPASADVHAVCGIANPGGTPCTKPKGHSARGDVTHDHEAYGPLSADAATTGNTRSDTVAPEGRSVDEHGWQPIETAPINGERVIAFEVLPEHLTRGKGPLPHIAIVYWWKGDELNAPRWAGDNFTQPTHWMPLPSPPSEQPHSQDSSEQRESSVTTEFSFILKPSTIHGVGVFATHPINAGTILRLFPVSEDVRHLKSVPPVFERYVVAQDSPEIMCPVDFGRMAVGWYLNHSDFPNVDIRAGYEYAAAKEINEGDELTIDYRKLDGCADFSSNTSLPDNSSVSPSEEEEADSKCPVCDAEKGWHRTACLRHPRFSGNVASQKSEQEVAREVFHSGALQIAMQAGSWFDRKDITLAEREMKVAETISDFIASALHVQKAAKRWNPDRVIAWMDDENRKPAIHAFTAGGERQIAYRVERLIEHFETHAKAVGAFLSEMKEIYSLDALEPEPITVLEVTEALLRVSREIREQMATTALSLYLTGTSGGEVMATDNRLEEIRQRLERYNKPPSPSDSRCTSSCPDSDYDSDRHTHSKECRFHAPAQAKYDFIANAPTDIDYLLAEIDRLKGENAIFRTADYSALYGNESDSHFTELQTLADGSLRCGRCQSEFAKPVTANWLSEANKVAKMFPDFSWPDRMSFSEAVAEQLIRVRLWKASQGGK